MIQQKHLSSSDSGSEDETVEDLSKNQLVALKKDKNARTSVSAEVYG